MEIFTSFPLEKKRSIPLFAFLLFLGFLFLLPMVSASCTVFSTGQIIQAGGTACVGYCQWSCSSSNVLTQNCNVQNCINSPNIPCRTVGQTVGGDYVCCSGLTAYNSVCQVTNSNNIGSCISGGVLILKGQSHCFSDGSGSLKLTCHSNGDGYTDSSHYSDTNCQVLAYTGSIIPCKVYSSGDTIQPGSSKCVGYCKWSCSAYGVLAQDCNDKSCLGSNANLACRTQGQTAGGDLVCCTGLTNYGGLCQPTNSALNGVCNFAQQQIQKGQSICIPGNPGSTKVTCDSTGLGTVHVDAFVAPDCSGVKDPNSGYTMTENGIKICKCWIPNIAGGCALTDPVCSFQNSLLSSFMSYKWYLVAVVIVLLFIFFGPFMIMLIKFLFHSLEAIFKSIF